MVIIPRVIEMTCKLTCKTVVCEEIFDNKESLEKCYNYLRKSISNKLKNISKEELENLPITITPFF